MVGLLQRLSISFAVGFVLVALTLGLYLYLSTMLASWQSFLIITAVVGLIIGIAATFPYVRHRRRLRRLREQIARFVERPSSKTLPAFREQNTVFGQLEQGVEQLCDAYLQTLSELVAQTDALTSLRHLLQGAEQKDSPDADGFERLGSSGRKMIARLTPNLRWSSATPALQEMLNRQMQHLSGKSFLDHISIDDRLVVERGFDEALDAGEAHNVSFRLVIPNNNGRPGQAERHVHMDVLTRYNVSGDPVHLRCFFVDVTDRVRGEEELRKRTKDLSRNNSRLLRINRDLERLKESYRDLYHNAPIMYFSLDVTGRLVTMNETLLRTLGYEREDILHQPYHCLLAPPQAEAWKRDETDSSFELGLHSLTRDGEMETQWIKKDGNILDVWIRSIAVKDTDGRFVRSRSAALDVTERNRLANELRARGNELERTNAQLLTINTELEEFTSVVSHDLKEPLRTLQAYSTLLAEEHSGELGPDGFQYINHLASASRRLESLIDDLLALSGAGRVLRKPEALDLIEIVAIVRRDLAGMIQRKEADLIVEGSLPPVIGDKHRIVQLLTNLVGNGLKYNKSPNPKVTIGQVTEPPKQIKGNRVLLYVRDNGIGIDPHFHDKIFGIFRRLHQPKEYEGTGAGLAICKKIVEAHGGQIWVESKPGQGASFFFSLPKPTAGSKELHRPSLQITPSKPPSTKRITKAIAKRSLEPARRTNSNARKPRVLLVEDLPEIALIVRRFAERGGHQVDWVPSAEQAAEYLRGQRPDLILLDIHLPGMNGIEFCQQLRATPEVATLTVALFTQGKGEESLPWAQSIGADFILSKDLLCNPAVWMQNIDEILQSQRVS